MNQHSRVFEEHNPSAPRPTFKDAYPIMLRVASARAASVAKAHGLSFDDRLDLEQEATSHAWRRLGVFDPMQSSLKTFIEYVVTNHLTSAIRRLRAEKRQVPPIRWPAHGVDSGADKIHLRIDVSRVLRKLPRAQRQVGLMLVHKSPSEVSRCTGVSRASVYRIIGELRVVFAAAGLAIDCRREGCR